MKGRLLLGILLVPTVLLAVFAAPVQGCQRFEYPGGKFEQGCDDESGGGAGSLNGWDIALGVLGVGLTVGGGIFAWTRVRKHRRSLRELLDEVESAFVASKNRDPKPGIERLSGLRAEVRARHAHGKLPDAQFLELDKRIGDYVVRLRIVDIERRFADLPGALITEIRNVAADQTVSAAEIAQIERRAVALGVAAPVRAQLKQHLVQWAGTDPGPPKVRKVAVVAKAP